MTCKACKAATQTVQHAASGVVGLTMSVLGPGASEEVVAERTETCDGCGHKKRLGGRGPAFCGHPIYGDADGGCGCYLPAKRRQKKKTCKKWKR